MRGLPPVGRTPLVWSLLRNRRPPLSRPTTWRGPNVEVLDPGWAVCVGRLWLRRWGPGAALGESRTPSRLVAVEASKFCMYSSRRFFLGRDLEWVPYWLSFSIRQSRVPRVARVFQLGGDGQVDADVDACGMPVAMPRHGPHVRMRSDREWHLYRLDTPKPTR